MDPLPSPEKLTEVRSLMKAGNKIAAIKVYREITGVGLAEAKEAVEKMVSDSNAPEAAGLPTNAPQKAGCMGLIAQFAGLVWAAGWWLR
jgi:Ribosomal protein L7/L12 C-terminal domain